MGCRQCYHIISSTKEKSAKVGFKKDGKKQGIIVAICSHLLDFRS